MPKSWYCIPSARPVAEVAPVVAKWKAMGYGVALQRDDIAEIPGADYVFSRNYQGYAEAVNTLAKFVLQQHPQVDWIVCGGDDTYPDPNKTGDEIARELAWHFLISEAYRIKRDVDIASPLQTFGVCQPTGHRWGEEDAQARQRWPDAPAYIDRVCGSPFMGREFCRRANGGLGPLHPEYFHMHVDEHLFEYAKMLGILLQRRDLTHFHNHWGLNGRAEDMPDFLKRANSPEHWRESKAILDRFKAEKFASCLPIA